MSAIITPKSHHYSDPPLSPPPPPPPLPPRMKGVSPPNEDDSSNDQHYSNDPRSASFQSLIPAVEDRNDRRTLLLIYIHGFMGKETSFQSFPAHIHNLLSITLAETHTVHTKIYPRYKSRKAIEFARDDFSKWLEPHETPSTDIILVGHSLGGILSCEVILLQCHRILGSINLDTPFLGLHPGIITTGIGSLFRPVESPLPMDSPGAEITTPSSSEQSPSSASLYPSHSGDALQPSVTPLATSISPLSSNDPNYNPSFPNDVRIVERKGWKNIFHFVNKHADGLTSATKEYLVSHLEFGSCLVDYQGLKARYKKIRHLEDVDIITSRQVQRVRFIQYYTASTGRPKKLKEAVVKNLDEQNLLMPLEVSINDLDHENNGSATIIIKPPEAQDSSAVSQVIEDNNTTTSSFDDEDQPSQVQIVECVPLDDYSTNDQDGIAIALSPTTSTQEISKIGLSPIAPLPAKPELVDLAVNTDKDARKIVENEQRRLNKAYQQALKDYDNGVKERQKLLKKRENRARQQREEQQKIVEKERQKNEKEKQRGKEKEKDKINTLPKVKAEKPKRDRKFCMLPSDIDGRQDVCWIRVYMEDVDEVEAHCGIFSPEKHYDAFVAEVGDRVEEWVKEDATRRTILEVEASGF